MMDLNLNFTKKCIIISKIFQNQNPPIIPYTSSSSSFGAKVVYVYRKSLTCYKLGSEGIAPFTVIARNEHAFPNKRAFFT